MQNGEGEGMGDGWMEAEGSDSQRIKQIKQIGMDEVDGVDGVAGRGQRA